MYDKINLYLIYGVIAFLIFLIIFKLYKVSTFKSKILRIDNLIKKNNITKALKLLDDLKNKELLKKEVIELYINIYEKIGNKQKILHYLSMLIELNFVNDIYEILEIKIKIAMILFDLNQVTDAYYKLLDVKEKGYYNYNWCMLMGKIYLSQYKIEKSLLYFERALFINKASNEAQFFINVVNFILKKEYGYKLLNAYKIFNNNKFLDIFIAIYFLRKENYEEAINYVLNFESFVKVKEIKNKEYYFLFSRILLIYSYFKLKKDITPLVAGLSVNLENYLIKEKNPFFSELILLYLLYIFSYYNTDLFNKYFIYLQKNFENYRNKRYNIYTFKLKFSNFEKKIESGTIVIDILRLSGKKPLELKPYQLKEDFKKFYEYKDDKEKRKRYLYNYNRIDKNKFIKVVKHIINLFGYKIKTLKYVKSTKFKGDGIDIKAIGNFPETHLIYIIVRRVKDYKFDTKYIDYLDNLRVKNKALKLILIVNVDLDHEFVEYVKSYENIIIYDRTRLGYLLESIVKK